MAYRICYAPKPTHVRFSLSHFLLLTGIFLLTFCAAAAYYFPQRFVVMLEYINCLISNGA